MTSFANPDGTFFNESGGQPALVLAPATGSTVLIPSTARDVYVNPAATIAALTVRLPGSVANGQQVSIGFGQTVTALTVQDFYGAAVAGAPTTGTAAGGARVLKYIRGASATGWVLWR